MYGFGTVAGLGTRTLAALEDGMRRWTLSMAILALLGCEGSIGTPPIDDPNDPSCRATGRCAGEVGPAVTSAYPRLSHQQWENTVRDLFGWSDLPGLSGTFAPDPRGTTVFDNDGTVLQVTPNLWEDYQAAAETIAQRVVQDADALARVTGGSTDPRAVYEGFLWRVFRRPLTAAEVDRYVALHGRGATHYPSMGPFPAGVRLVLEAALQSPHFLYRNEDGEVREGRITLNAWQLASRLSYTLWDTMPDDTLFDAARSGALVEGRGLAGEAARMLDDVRAEAKIRAFHRQLFELGTYDDLRVDGLGSGIGRAMREETERFIADVILENDGGVRELLTASHTFVNAELASLYGLDGVSGEGFTRVELDPTQRAGVLTHPGFIVRKRGDTAPILRGVYINMRVMCAHIPEPPEFEPPVPAGVTRRERIHSITGPGTCGATCHAEVINPIGFAFETFDDRGQWRTEDNGRPVDALSSYWFGGELVTFDGPVELMHALADATMTHRCYAQNWLEYAFGRPMQPRDVGTLESIAGGSQREGWSVKEILVALVDSETFRTRAPQPEEE